MIKNTKKTCNCNNLISNIIPWNLFFTSEAFLNYILKKYEIYNANYKEYTFLGFAILEQNEILVNYLLQFGSNPNIISVLNNNFYPIEQVIINMIKNSNNSIQSLKNYNILKLLLNSQANVNLYSEEEPLLLAVYFKLYDIVDLLLEHGANPYMSIILCISKLKDLNLSRTERTAWKKLKNLINNYSYKKLFESIEFYLSRHYYYSPLKAERLFRMNSIIMSSNSINFMNHASSSVAPAENNSDLAQSSNEISLPLWLWQRYTASIDIDLSNITSTQVEDTHTTESDVYVGNSFKCSL